MKIEFGKTLEGIDDLRDYITERKAIRCIDPSTRLLIRYDYDYQSLERDLVDRIALEFPEDTHQSRRTATNALWVQEPYSFQLIIDGRGSYHRNTDADITPEKNTAERIRTNHESRLGGLLGSRTVSTEREIPFANITGQVAYESFECVDPTKVLDVLQKFGFTSKVITTPEELAEALERAKRSGRTVYRSRSSSDDGSGLGAFAAGAFIGLSLGD